EAKTLHVIFGKRAERHEDDDAVRRNDEPRLLERCSRIRQASPIDNHPPWLHRWPAIRPRNRPTIDGDDSVALFDQLCAQQGAFGPLRTEQYDVRSVRIHLASELDLQQRGQRTSSMAKRTRRKTTRTRATRPKR